MTPHVTGVHEMVQACVTSTTQALSQQTSVRRAHTVFTRQNEQTLMPLMCPYSISYYIPTHSLDTWFLKRNTHALMVGVCAHASVNDSSIAFRWASQSCAYTNAHLCGFSHPFESNNVAMRCSRAWKWTMMMNNHNNATTPTQVRMHCCMAGNYNERQKSSDRLSALCIYASLLPIECLKLRSIFESLFVVCF